VQLVNVVSQSQFDGQQPSTEDQDELGTGELAPLKASHLQRFYVEQPVVTLDDAIVQFCEFYQILASFLQSNQVKQFSKAIENSFDLATRLVIKVQKFISNKGSMTRLPEWFKSITVCIKVLSPAFSLIAIEGMIEVLVNARTNPVYEQLKNLIVEESKAKINERNELIHGNEYTRIALEKLWSLLDLTQY